MKVLVLDGNNRAALAITRALGKEGYDVIVGSDSQPCLAGVSAFCKKKIIYSSPQKSMPQFIQDILHILKDHKPDILLPVSDITTMAITSNRNDIEKLCSIPFPTYASVLRAADKVEVMKIAESIGIGVPSSIVIQNASEVNEGLLLKHFLKFPLVIKPQRSKLLLNHRWQATSVSYASNIGDLVNILNEMPKEHYPVIIQERIIGPGVGVFLCLNHGEVVGCFRHRRLREKPPTGGVSVLRESVPPIQSLIDKSKKLLNELEWQGIAMVEFKQDNRDKSYKLMEINGRFWGSLQLAIDAGVNFPTILAKIALNEKIIPVMSYKIGVKTRWFFGDLDVLLKILFDSSSLKLPENFPSKKQTLIDFLKLREKNVHYEVLKFHDIKPWLYELQQYLEGIKKLAQPKK